MGMTNDSLSYWQAESEGIDLLDITIGDLFDRRADELPAQEAVVYSCYPEFGDALNVRWTYQEYRDWANQVARDLMALGLNKGDHIAVWAVNLPEWLLLMAINAQTNRSAYGGCLPTVGASVDKDSMITPAQPGDPDLHNIAYTGVTTSAVGADRVLRFAVGTKSYIFTIPPTADLSDFGGNAQAIGINVSVKVKVQYPANTIVSVGNANA